MRNELNAMIQKIDDPEYKKVRSPARLLLQSCSGPSRAS